MLPGGGRAATGERTAGDAPLRPEPEAGVRRSIIATADRRATTKDRSDAALAARLRASREGHHAGLPARPPPEPGVGVAIYRTHTNPGVARGFSSAVMRGARW